MKDWGNSTVATLYMYQRVWDILNLGTEGEVCYALSRLHDELAHNYFVDTGRKVGEDL